MHSGSPAHVLKLMTRCIILESTATEHLREELTATENFFSPFSDVVRFAALSEVRASTNASDHVCTLLNSLRSNSSPRLSESVDAADAANATLSAARP